GVELLRLAQLRHRLVPRADARPLAAHRLHPGRPRGTEESGGIGGQERGYKHLMFEVFGLSVSKLASVSRPPGRTVEVPGRGDTFVYEMDGPPDAPVLFLIHGLVATTQLNWFPAFPVLADRYRVVATDLRGHGRGFPAGNRFRLSDCADDLAAVADVLGIERFIPVGYSLGGPVAQLVWHRHRDRVEGLVLCATSRNFGGTLQERLFYRLLPALSAAIRLAGRGQAPDGAIAEVGAALGFGPDAMLSRWALSE